MRDIAALGIEIFMWLVVLVVATEIVKWILW
jgi:hypothetical protein